MNFKDETLEILVANGKTWNDVKFIQGNDFKASNNKDELLELMNFDYDDGYGAPEIAQDLKIVGDNWWLERAEYDGSEWWEYKETPKPNLELKKIKRFQVKDNQAGWKSLKDVNKEEN